MQDNQNTNELPEEVADAIQKLNDYFVREIIAGNYTIISIDQYHVGLSVKSHRFYLWIGSHDFLFGIYPHQNSFISLEFTEEDKNILPPRFLELSKEKVAENEKLARFKKWEELNAEFAQGVAHDILSMRKGKNYNTQ